MSLIVDGEVTSRLEILDEEIAAYEARVEDALAVLRQLREQLDKRILEARTLRSRYRRSAAA